MCTVKFFFVSGCVQLIGALACATTEEQVSFLLLLSLPSTYLCARMAGKTLCAVHRLFSRSSIRRQTMRADRQTTEGERGAQVRKAARGALETCATLPVLLSAAPSLCIAFQAAMLRVCTCVFFVFGFSPNGSHFFFSLDADARTAEPFASSSRRWKDQKARRFVVGSHRRTTLFRVGLCRYLRMRLPQSRSLPRNDRHARGVSCLCVLNKETERKHDGTLWQGLQGPTRVLSSEGSLCASQMCPFWICFFLAAHDCGQ